MNKLKRNAQAVLAQLSENQAGQVVTKVPCKIQVPVRFSEGNVSLSKVGIETFVYGCFPIILESGDYAVCNVCAFIELDPYKTTISIVDDVEYHNFFFEAGSVVIKTTDLVSRDTIIYNVFDEFIFKGKLPWYLTYEDVGKIFDTSKEYANSDVNRNYEVVELVASIVTRPKHDKTKYLRTTIQSYDETSAEKIAFVPLTSVFYSVNSNVNKIAGNYFTDGLTSALTNRVNNVDQVESILRT